VIRRELCRLVLMPLKALRRSHSLVQQRQHTTGVGQRMDLPRPQRRSLRILLLNEVLS
jgi:hypothetical protein